MVKIIEGWYYEKDQRQYVLIRNEERVIKNNRTGETRKEMCRDIIGYYTSMGGMIKKVASMLADDKIASGEITTIQEHIETMQKNIEELISNGTGDM